MRVIHFVTAGFSGATNVAKEIIKYTDQTSKIQSMLVLRKRRSTSTERIKSFQVEGIDTQAVTGKINLLSIYELYKLCKTFKPDILIVHGFSEHLWGRYAGLIAKVPHLIHVEHNSRERYTWFRLKQAQWLAKYTDKIIGCSEGVRQSLLKLGFPPEKTIAIPNGTDITRFTVGKNVPFEQRKPDIIMASRFSRQKDQACLIDAIALLRDKGVKVNVTFAGLGNKAYLKKAQKRVNDLNLGEQTEFLGYINNLPELLATHQLFVLSTHYEGMPLAIIEAMAAGCAIIASEVVGVKEMFDNAVDGSLVTPQSPQAMADAIEELITNPNRAKQLAMHGQRKATSQFSLQKMGNAYQELFHSLMDNTSN